MTFEHIRCLHCPAIGRRAGGPEHLLRDQGTDPSARACRDAAVGLALKKLWEDNYGVCGARKLWKAARRAGHDIGRDEVARHMRAAGITRARRGRRLRTTKPDPGAPRHPDLVGRDFTAAAPNQLWVTDLVHVRAYLGRCGLRVLYHRRVQPDDRGRLTEIGAVPSIGTVGYSFDKGLAS